MQLNPNQPPRKSINLAIPDFLNLIGTPVGGRSRQQSRQSGTPLRQSDCPKADIDHQLSKVPRSF
jgi:hypothetical protein